MTMSPPTTISLTFPDFRGATRRLVLLNLAAFFIFLIISLAFPARVGHAIELLAFVPSAFLRGAIWQPFTYSLLQFGLLQTFLNLLCLWFFAGFLENYHTSSWVTGIYAISVLGTAATATAIFAAAPMLGFRTAMPQLTGCSGGIFGLLVAIGFLHGDVQFMLFPLPINVKARHLAAIFAVIYLAMVFGQQSVYAFAVLGGGLFCLLYIQLAPRRGLHFAFSEKWFGLRNRYYRWKRRRAARKFEVYMRSQGRTIHLDGHGRQIDDDQDDKTRWN
jgi:membrane associated rhomboid family serine protease